MLVAAAYDELITKVPTLMHGGRQIDACIVSLGIAHFQPFESKFLQLLLHSCRIVLSVAPGSRSSAVERMKRSSAAHCNSPPPRNIPSRAGESTLKLFITLLLATVQSLLYAYEDFHNETLRNNAALARDPPRTVLGMSGMGTSESTLPNKRLYMGFASNTPTADAWVSMMKPPTKPGTVTLFKSCSGNWTWCATALWPTLLGPRQHAICYSRYPRRHY